MSRRGRTAQLLPPLVAAMSSSAALLVGPLARHAGTCRGRTLILEEGADSKAFTLTVLSRTRGNCAGCCPFGKRECRSARRNRSRSCGFGMPAKSMQPLSYRCLGRPRGCVAVSDDGSLVATVAVGPALFGLQVVWRSTDPCRARFRQRRAVVVLRFAPNAKAIGDRVKGGPLDDPRYSCRGLRIARNKPILRAINALVFAADGASLLLQVGTDEVR